MASASSSLGELEEAIREGRPVYCPKCGLLSDPNNQGFQEHPSSWVMCRACFRPLQLHDPGVRSVTQKKIVDGIEVPSGLKVTFRHLRRSDPPMRLASVQEIVGAGRRVLPQGGTTLAILEHVGSGSRWEGRARCNTSDNYVKGVGRKIALGRALASMDLKSRRLHAEAWGVHAEIAKG